MKEDISTENAPVLSESECTLVNLYRILPKKMRDALMNLVFALAMNEGGKDDGEKN
jgi:hypothetical protein